MTRELTWPGLHPGDLRAAAAVVGVQAQQHPFMAPLARRLLEAANAEPATEPDHEEDES